MSDPWAAILKGAQQESFPGAEAEPRPGELRIAIEKKPYAAMIGHAISDPEVELCGVLAGFLKKDKHGPWVHVVDTIQGEKAAQAGANVTFTHDTWDHIHKEMDKHPERKIVGWYHTHPGFGIFLSEMDRFIHDNFFSEPFHFAYVYDPLAGSEGFFFKRGDELQTAPRYWIGGKPRPCFTRAEPPPEPGGAAGPGPATGDDAVRALHRAVAALQQTVEARQEAIPTSWIVAFGGVLALLVLVWGLGGRSAPAAPRSRVARPVLVVQEDRALGVSFGVELHTLQRGGGELIPMYRDADGERFYAIEAVPIDSSTVTVKELLRRRGQEARSPESQAAPPGGGDGRPRGSVAERAPGEAGGGTLAVAAVAVIGLVLAALAGAALLVRRREAGGRS